MNDTSNTSSKETFRDIINGERPVLIDFFAEWCGPCKAMKPELHRLHEMTGEKLRILKLDIDKNPDVARAFSISSVPTLMLIKKGDIKWRQSGLMQAQQLQQVLQPYL